MFLCDGVSITTMSNQTDSAHLFAVAARRQQTARMYSADVAQDGQERRARTVLIKELFGEANVPVR